MTDAQPPKKHRDKPPSIFFPILIIAIGVYILLVNLNVLPGDFWNTFWRLWPVLFIAGGLDGLIRRENMVTSSLFVVVGTIFVLCNFDYLPYNVLELVLLLWPLILVAIGFDLIVGKRSIWISLAGIAIFTVILFGALWYVQPDARAGQVEVTNILQPLEGAEQARVDIEIGAGTLDIVGLDSDSNLVEGVVPSGENFTVIESYSVDDAGAGDYHLTSEGSYVYTPGTRHQEWTWDLKVNKEVANDLMVSIGAGTSYLELSAFNLENLSINLAVGTGNIYLPETGSYQGEISMAVGSLTIHVPAGVGVRIRTETGLTAVVIQTGYEKQGNIYTSPEFGSSDNQVDLKIDNAVGTIVIQEN